MSDAATSGNATAHTPGPWHVESGTIICAGDLRLTRTAEAYTEMRDGSKFYETRANARLMAAAPDLLEALKDAVNFIGRLSNGDELGTSQQAWNEAYEPLKKARAALDKAGAI